MERRLTAILAADVVGYSRLMGEDEVGTLARLKTCRRDVVDPAIQMYHGRIIKLMGDGALVEFASVVDAVQCAATIQRSMSKYDQGVPEAQHIRFRIGVNLGDIIVEDDDIHGDGVNIAARLEALAEPGGICISGMAFDHARHKADVGFANAGEQRLKNIADPVRIYRVLLDPAKKGRVIVASRLLSTRTLVLMGVMALLIAMAAVALMWQRSTSPERPAVAVLPFANLTGDPSQDYFADGITEDLITDLAKLSGLDVIARNSVFAYKGKPFVLADIARDLGVRFAIEGSVRRTGDQIRLNAQLVDIATGGTLWANRFDRSTREVFAVQDEISREIAKALGVQPSAAESERMARPPTENLEAYDYYLRAEQAARTGQRARLGEALELYEKAVEVDPAFAEAYAGDARTTVYVWRVSFNEIIQSAPARKRAYEKASRALALNPDLSSPYAILGIMQVVDQRYEEAIASARRAVALSPGDAGAQVALGYVQLFAGDHAEAATAVETALRLDPNLSPIDREIAGLVFLLGGDTAKAIGTLERTRADAPAAADFHITLAAAYARAGRLTDAHAAMANGLRLQRAAFDSIAAWRVSYAHFRNKDDLALLIDALRQAGMPEWAFGFRGKERDRLTGEEIALLVLGHTLQGQIEPGYPAIMQIDRNGNAAFRSITQLLTGTVHIDRDLLCEKSENMFGRPDCGPVYKQTDSTGKRSYAYANASKVFYFSQVK
ncbi:MAG TPA: tetratricopeptide repeat protein [Aestuariivirgaceae bacterium]|nr:tetratricopeptide repeat protein [Aestuariivirgaceae bacterium]